MSETVLREARTLVVKRRPVGPSETFVTAHVERLPGCTSFYAPSPPAGIRRWAHAALRRVGRDDATQGWVPALRSSNPDVVLAEYGPTGVAVLRACRRLGVPLVVYFHGYDATRQAVVTRLAKAYRRVFEYSHALVAASSGIAEELRRLGAPEQKVHHIPCGVDISQFDGAKPDQAPPTVVAVGRLVEKKAPLLTIRAFSIALQAHPSARLVMIGDGPLREACESLVAELGLAHRVTLLGVQGHDVVLNELRGARLFAQHSLRAANGDTEGTPVAITEAHACGLPVVATRHGGIPDVVSDGDSGFLVDERDVVTMAEAMALLLADGGLAREMGARGRVRVEQHFDQQLTNAALAAILAKAARGRAPVRQP